MQTRSQPLRGTPVAWIQGPKQVQPPHSSLVAALEAGAREKAPFLTLHGSGGVERLDANQAFLGASRLAALLSAHGVKKGDRVPILLPTSLDFVHTLLGTMLLGAVPVPLASPMTFGSLDRYVLNLSRIVEDAGARCMVTTERVAKALRSDPNSPTCLKSVLTRADLSSAPDRHAPTTSVDSEDLALLQYTSGTTGRPKGVALTHEAMVANTCAISRGMDLTSSDVGVSWLPMFHDMGLIGIVLTTLCHPYPVHLLAPESFVMRPRRWLSLMSEVGGTLSAAPNFAYDLCSAKVESDDLDLRSWRRAFNGSEAVHRSTVERFEGQFAEAGFRGSASAPVYGLAEATLAVTFSPANEPVRFLAADRRSLEEDHVFQHTRHHNARSLVSVGRPVQGTAVRIVEKGGRPSNGDQVLEEGQVGEIQVSGPSLMQGYFRNPKATQGAFSDGWLRTGDLGLVVDGELYITGRAKDVIILGGRNVYPEDVERVVADKVGRAYGVAAFSRVNHEKGTEELIVALEVRERDFGKRATLETELRGELLAVLGIRVNQVLLWPVGAIPRTTSGKIRRGQCRNELFRKEKREEDHRRSEADALS